MMIKYLDDIFFRHMENMIIPMMPFTGTGGNEPALFQYRVRMQISFK